MLGAGLATGMFSLMDQTRVGQQHLVAEFACGICCGNAKTYSHLTPLQLYPHFLPREGPNRTYTSTSILGEIFNYAKGLLTKPPAPTTHAQQAPHSSPPPHSYATPHTFGAHTSRPVSRPGLIFGPDPSLVVSGAPGFGEELAQAVVLCRAYNTELLR